MTDRLGSEWTPHEVPIADINAAWEQIAPIPTFHWVERSFDGSITVDHLWYLYQATNLGINAAGGTLEEAEMRLRKAMPFKIELAEGDIIEPSPPILAMAEEVSQYVRRKSSDTD